MSVLKNLSWQIIFASFLLVALFRNLLLPIIADDYSYAFIWDGEHWGNLIDGVDPNNFQRVESFSDILASQWEHYFHWGGRTDDCAHFRSIFRLAGEIVLLTMMFSPEFPERAGFPSTIFLLVASVSALKEILPELNKIYSRHVKKINIAGNIFACVFVLSVLGVLYVEKDLSDQLDARMEYVLAHRGDDLITVPLLEIPAWSGTFLGSRTWTETLLW